MPRKTNTDNHIRYFDSFPSRLRELMQEHGTTQEEMKTVLNLATRQAVTGYIDGRISPSVEKLTAIADYYGVSADYLLGLADSRTREGEAQSAETYTGLSASAVTALHEQTAAYEVSSKTYLSDLSDFISSPRFRVLIGNVDDLRRYYNQTVDAVNALQTFVPVTSPEERAAAAASFQEALASLRESLPALRLQLFELSGQWFGFLEEQFPSRELIETAKALLKRHGEGE